ncbi:unnamed protein product [Triticum aestivum]|uniref:GRAM domain-containing protein n=1 Tax=Triticum aestivum TaxID=4565 RepID=A0A7H4LKJ0_WHEAT|nr:unnamed protein product [Triticum aestivum]
MDKAGHEHVIGIPVSSTAIGIEEPEFTNGDAKYSTSARTGGKSGRRTGDKFARGIKEHVSLGPKLYETVRGKLSLGARILQAGGVEKVFRRWFAVEKGEKLLNASQCYLSTTAGPIAGMLFVSTEKVAFRSDRSLALTTPKGDTVRVPYKVVVPLRRVKAANPSENQHRPEQKYVQLVTDDGFEFWFMGFVSYQASLQHLEQAIGAAGGGMKAQRNIAAGSSARCEDWRSPEPTPHEAVVVELVAYATSLYVSMAEGNDEPREHAWAWP